MGLSRVISNIDVSLGDIELATNYLYGDKELFEPDLSEIKVDIYKKDVNVEHKDRDIVNEEENNNDVIEKFALEIEDTENESKANNNVDRDFWETEVQGDNVLGTLKIEDTKENGVNEYDKRAGNTIEQRETGEEAEESTGYTEERPRDTGEEEEENTGAEEEVYGELKGNYESDVEDEDTEEFEIDDTEDEEETLDEETEDEDEAIEELDTPTKDDIDNRIHEIEEGLYEKLELQRREIERKAQEKIAKEREELERKLRKREEELRAKEEAIRIKKKAFSEKEKKNRVISEVEKEEDRHEKQKVDFDKMKTDALYKIVRAYIIKNNNAKIVSILELNERFGASNINRLLKGSYLIKIGKGVTIGV